MEMVLEAKDQRIAELEAEMRALRLLEQRPEGMPERDFWRAVALRHAVRIQQLEAALASKSDMLAEEILKTRKLQSEVRALREVERVARLVEKETVTTIPVCTPGIAALAGALEALDAARRKE